MLLTPTFAGFLIGCDDDPCGDGENGGVTGSEILSGFWSWKVVYKSNT
jgi:hypothetical protein